MAAGDSPKISVILPVYNAQETLTEAVDSILRQTFADFELLIFDDASTDATPEILQQYAASDRRIRMFRNERNMNYCYGLNKGLALAEAPIIARMDADDVSMLDRFERQYALLEAHPEITLCAGRMELYEAGSVIRFPLRDEEIRVHLLRDSCMPHPSWMGRKEAFLEAGGYACDFLPAEDYALLAMLSAMPGVRFANLPEPIIRYRMHPHLDRSAYREKQRLGAAGVRASLLRSLVPEADDTDRMCHEILCAYERRLTLSELARCGDWLRRLFAANAAVALYDEDVFQDFWRRHWFNLCSASCTPSMFLAGVLGLGGSGLRRSFLVMAGHFLQRKLLPSRLRHKHVYRLTP